MRKKDAAGFASMLNGCVTSSMRTAMEMRYIKTQSLGSHERTEERV